MDWGVSAAGQEAKCDAYRVIKNELLIGVSVFGAISVILIGVIICLVLYIKRIHQSENSHNNTKRKVKSPRQVITLKSYLKRPNAACMDRNSRHTKETFEKDYSGIYPESAVNIPCGRKSPNRPTSAYVTLSPLQTNDLIEHSYTYLSKETESAMHTTCLPNLQSSAHFKLSPAQANNTEKDDTNLNIESTGILPVNRPSSEYTSLHPELSNDSAEHLYTGIRSKYEPVINVKSTPARPHSAYTTLMPDINQTSPNNEALYQELNMGN